MYKPAQQFLEKIQGMEQEQVARWSGYLLLAAFSYSAALATWQLVELLRGPQQPELITQPVAVSGRQASRPPDAAHLFGRQDSASSVTAAPDTNLNLSLTGLIASDTASGSLAFIRVGGGAEKSYAIGDQVTAGVVVKEIHSDRVILLRNGRAETLRLPQSFAGIAIEDSEAKPAASSTGIESRLSGEEVARFRQQLLNTPNELVGLIRHRPVRRNGKIAGYRLFAGKDRELFNRLGLKPGDMVTAINGMPLTDPASAMELYAQLPSMNELKVSLERGGQAMELVLPWQ